MPKYLVQARYTTVGIQGLVKDSASGRRADVQAAVKTLGGKVEAFYYAFGDDDVVLILDLPNNIKAAALGLTISGSGAVRVRTTPLLTVEDVDQALEIRIASDGNGTPAVQKELAEADVLERGRGRRANQRRTINQSIKHHPCYVH
jgi:uncharacterized protein with GYD domain